MSWASPEYREECRRRRLVRAGRVWRAATDVRRGRVIRVRDVMRETEMATNAVLMALADLEALGYVERAPVGQTGRYGMWTLVIPCVEVGR